MATFQFNSNLINFPVVSGNTSYTGSLGSTGEVADATLANSAIFGCATSGLAKLFVFKGTIPTDFSVFNSIDARISDLLVIIPVNSVEIVDYESPTGVRWRVGGSSGTTAIATGTGVASWFCLARTNSSFTTASSFADFGVMTGNIGITGSNADLTIPDINIVSGLAYKSNGMYINWPFTWDI
jgi:hypothetical protein